MLKEYYAKIKELGIGKLLLILLAGMLLVLSGGWGDESNKGKNKTENELQENNELLTNTSAKESLWEKSEMLEEIISQIKGVEQARVMIAFEDQGERVLISEKKQDLSNRTENDVAGGTRVEVTQRTEEEYLTQGDTPYVIKNIVPSIRGVVVVFRGNTNCSKDITEAIKVLTGVDYNRIKVLSMN